MKRETKTKNKTDKSLLPFFKFNQVLTLYMSGSQILRKPGPDQY